MDSLISIISVTLLYSAPLIYTSLGGVISENAGVVNIGLEGMMTIGALVSATVGFYFNNPWLAFLAGGLASMMLALLHAIATVSFAADHVVSGIALNFLGPGLSLFLCRIFFDGAAMSKPISLNHKIPQLGKILKSITGKEVFSQGSFSDKIFNQYMTVYLALFMVFVVWFVLYKTKLGLRIRSVGEHPRAAETLGVNVFKIKYVAVLLSGLLAGFGGASMALAVASNYRVTLISGQGFIALAAMIFGKWKPQGALGACLLFGAAQGVVVLLGNIGSSIPSELIEMIPYIATLVILMGFVGGSSAPKADGIPYEKH